MEMMDWQNKIRQQVFSELLESIDQKPEKFTDLYAESALMGALLFGTYKDAILDIVKPEMFWLPQHQDIASEVLFMMEVGENVDAITVASNLGRKNNDPAVVHMKYLDALVELGQEFSQIEAYALTVRDLWKVRTAVKKAGVWLRKMDTQEIASPEKAVEELIEGLIPITAKPDAVLVPFHEIDVEKEHDLGVTTGIPAMDRHIATRGYPAGQVTVVEAYHKSGKSTYLLTSFFEQVKKGFDPVYVSFADLNALRIKRRLMRMMTCYSEPAHCPSLDAINEWHQEHKWLCERDPRIVNAMLDDYVSTIEGTIRTVEALHRKRPVDVIFLDYLQRIETNAKSVSEYERMRTVVKKITRWAARSGIPIVVASQVTPGGKDGQTISKGGRDIEEDAGWVLRLQREGDSPNIEIETVYNRFGTQGRKESLIFDKNRLRVSE